MVGILIAENETVVKFEDWEVWRRKQVVEFHYKNWVSLSLEHFCHML